MPPEQHAIPALEPIDREQLARLTAQESFSVEGQIAKMKMIEKMIRDRWVQNHERIQQLLGDTLSGDALQAEVSKQVQHMHMYHLDLGDGRYNLIVEKGEDFEEDGDFDPDIYRVMIPAHVDTVPDSGAPLELTEDVKIPDHWKGLGVYDMGAGILNNIALASKVVVPKGMKAYFVFTVDEENDSVGIRELIKQWDAWKYIDCIVTSEIGPVKPLPDDDPRLRLLIARRGRTKLLFSLKIAPEHQGHGAEEGLPNATDADIEMAAKLKLRFNNPFEDEPPLQKKHPFLGHEQFVSGKIDTEEREGLFNPHEGKFRYSILTVPPTTGEEVVREQKRIAAGIAKRGNWKRWGIDMSLTENTYDSSYDPYDMPPDHPLIALAARVIKKVTGEYPDMMGAPSVADECDMAAAMKAAAGVNSFADTTRGIINIPPNGNHAHHPNECVSQRSIESVREAVRMLIEDEKGLLQMKKKK